MATLGVTRAAQVGGTAAVYVEYTNSPSLAAAEAVVAVAAGWHQWTLMLMAA
jgi:hypothetical protein